MPQRKPSFIIPERFLRQLWKHQLFSTSNLTTADEKPVHILSPGTVNSDGGPDFRDARIRIGGILYRGEVELHKNLEEWNEHAHHLDPKYNGVILHVVFEGDAKNISTRTKSKRNVPVLILSTYLTSRFRETWDRMILDERAERLRTIRCFTRNHNVEASVIRKWIEKLAIERIEMKVRRFEERLKELVDEQFLSLKEPQPQYHDLPFGINPEDLPPPTHQYSRQDFAQLHLWEQLLYEGIMEALGYSKNQQPFVKLARNLRLRVVLDFLQPSDAEQEVRQFETMLFGGAGLLPSLRQLSDPESKRRVRELRSRWKEIRQYYTCEIIHEAEWQFFRLRPENFPTVRLAGAARVLQKLLHDNLFKTVVQTMKETGRTIKKQFIGLQSHFIISPDEFWTTHYRFGEVAKKPLTTLIGKSRANDIILNAVIPICLLYARVFKVKDIRQRTLLLFEECPPLSDNTITRIIDDQLIKKKFELDAAMLQQGSLQLYKMYCAEERCSECAVGRVAFTSAVS